MEIRGKRRKHGGDEDQARAGGREQLLMLPMLGAPGVPGAPSAPGASDAWCSWSS